MSLSRIIIPVPCLSITSRHNIVGFHYDLAVRPRGEVIDRPIVDPLAKTTGFFGKSPVHHVGEIPGGMRAKVLWRGGHSLLRELSSMAKTLA